LQAPPHWRCIDFISDLHLQASEPQTFVAWRDYLNHTTADAVFILGDLFEVWVGDDVLSDSGNFENQCAEVLRTAAQRLDIFIMQGNRDFLMGAPCMQACAATLLPDPTVLSFADQRWLLTHGDALCLDDTAYMQFRQLVHSAQWQAGFLAKPLLERKEMARQLRMQSEAIKQDKKGQGDPSVYVDVDTGAALQSLQTAHATTMIHGHTHRPGKHTLGTGCERLVLSDWDLGALPPRADVLRIERATSNPTTTTKVQRLTPEQACATAPKPGY